MVCTRSAVRGRPSPAAPGRLWEAGRFAGWVPASPGDGYGVASIGRGGGRCGSHLRPGGGCWLSPGRWPWQPRRCCRRRRAGRCGAGHV